MNEIDTSRFFGAVLKAIACTRNHGTDTAEYAAGVVEPAARIREFEGEVAGRPLTRDEVAQVLEWLDTTFRTKRTPDEEREHYHRYIAEVSGLARAAVAVAE